jgi:DNA modification methylase
MKKENLFLVGDNLKIMQSMEDDSVQMIYLDPPYNTGRDFGEFQDRFPSMNSYALEFLRPRILEMHRILEKTGNIIVHVEPKNSHHVRMVLDDVFGEKRFRNEIVWKSGGNAKNLKQLGRHHDVLIVYSKGLKPTFNPMHKPYDEQYKKRSSAKQQEDGRWYVTTAIHNSQPDINPRVNLRYEWNNHHKQWYVSKGKMETLESQKRLVYNKKGIPRIKRFLDEMDGIPLKDLWIDISQIQGSEKLNYPTQKPVKLLERVISLYSNEGDRVFDPFAGSGTIGRAAITLKRKYILVDINEKGRQIFLESLEASNRT